MTRAKCDSSLLCGESESRAGHHIVRPAVLASDPQSREALERVGLRTPHCGSKLDAGERPHVVLARILLHEPGFLVTEEPTDDLDGVAGRVSSPPGVRCPITGRWTRSSRRTMS
jgi:ABC-type phosphate/phosphonate transport system ATPase subunit